MEESRFDRNLCTTELTRSMMRAIKYDEHNSYFIYGKRGAGKSTYAMLCSYSIYRNWEKVLHYMVFSRQDIIDIIAKCFDEEGNIIMQIPVLIWDDATFTNMKSRMYDPFIDEFAKFLAVIRTVVKNIIFTAPAFESMPQKLKDYDWTIVRITKPTVMYPKAHFYDYNTSPTKKFFRRKYWNDQFITETFSFLAFPDDIRKKYNERRNKYSWVGFKNFKAANDFSEKLMAINKDEYSRKKRNINKLKKDINESR